ncbi:SDR family oxidoreductase [Streptomyces griseus]|uniref:SDR family oxidoreductase n=1 Tax=Streptomyces griseus TaxID=1911 RepID=UPI0036748DD0
MAKLTGRTALVTGASRGIGRATAIRLAQEGALIAVHYGHDETSARETVDAIEKDGGRAFTVRAELDVPGDVDVLFQSLEQGLAEHVGATTLDILVNNAGISEKGEPGTFSGEQFDRLFAVNARAPFLVLQRALPNLADNGRVINISSALTRLAKPDEVLYAMTKGAVEQLTLHYAKHLAPRGITVNTVAPGITDNGSAVFSMPAVVEQMARYSAFNGVARAEDVAHVVAFAASDEARWVTGAFLDASGGSLLG